MAKRPLSVQLRPCSAVEPVSASSHAAAGANSRSARRLSMGDIILDQHRLSAELTNRAGQHGGSNPAAGRRPADLCIAVGPCSVAAGGLPRRRDRCSPSWCKRPIVTTLPRLDLSLIQGRKNVYDKYFDISFFFTFLYFWFLQFPSAVLLFYCSQFNGLVPFW